MGNICKNSLNNDSDLVEEEIVQKKITGILVVDDLNVIFTLIKQWFKLNNYTVPIKHAKTGYIAKDFLNENPEYNVVFMDIKMSPIDGFESTKLLINNEYKGLILGVSGMIDSESIKYGIKCGMKDIFPKPIMFDELIIKLKSYGYFF